MVVWDALASELHVLLGQLGAFRAIRTWHLRLDGGTAAISPVNPAAPPRSPRELVDPPGRQAILVFTDCVDDSWPSGTAIRAVDAWAHTGPVAILQPLSQRLWSRSALRCHQLQLRAPEPGAPNHQLIVNLAKHHVDVHPARVPVPVLEIAPGWLASWARVIDGEKCLADVIATFADAPPAVGSPDAPTGPEPENTDPVRIVERFMAGASAEAFRLAGFLSSAPVSLPLMRLIQQCMLPDPRSQQLAEVYLGGLLRRVEPYDPSGAGKADRLDFLPGVRDVLLGSIRRSEIIRVAELVSGELSRRHGTAPTGFTAFLRTAANNTGKPPSDEGQAC